MKGNSGSPYDFTPKIADFGLFSRVRSKRKGKSSSSESIGFDNIGNQRFSESHCITYLLAARLKLHVHSSTDAIS